MSEPQPFTSVEQTKPKNRASQLLVIAALLVTVFGGIWAIAGERTGLWLLVGGFVALIVLTVWSIRNWDWER